MSTFRFQQFSIRQSHTAMKVGTDSMILGALSHFQHPKSLLDVGTGTGVLSLMLAQRYPEALIHAIETDDGAAIDAGYNFAESPFAERLQLFQADFNTFTTQQRYDGIISNPPYFENSYKSNSHERNTARHTDTLSYSDLCTRCASMLAANGCFQVILPTESTAGFIQHATNAGMHLHSRIRIFGKPGKEVRTIMAFTLSAVTEITEHTFTVRDEKGQYSPEYKKATAAFHGVSLK